MTSITKDSPGHVFISFASEDAEVANRIVEKLEGAGIRCWIAHRDIEAVDRYPAAITAAMSSSAAVLLLLTPAANASPHVLREIEMAFNGRTPILPVRMGGVLPSADLQYFISTTQWFDAGPSFDDGDAALIESRLKRLFSGETAIEPVKDREQRRWRIALVSGGLAIAALLVAFLVWSYLPRNSPAGEGAASQPDQRPAPTAPVPSPVDTSKPADATKASTGRTKVNPRDGQAYAWIPPGEYVMGCSSGDPACDEDEKPAHTVRVRRGFWLATTEVTEAQYRKKSPAGGSDSKAAEASVPATDLTRADAKNYCASIGGRVPTEAEWEYAARAGTPARYYDTPSLVAWYEANSDGSKHPVGMKKPNAFGLYDMLGNVAEWVLDRYYNAYDDSEEEGAVEEPVALNATAVVRGGSWASDARGVRASNRIQAESDTADAIIGVRCAVNAL